MEKPGISDQAPASSGCQGEGGSPTRRSGRWVARHPGGVSSTGSPHLAAGWGCSDAHPKDGSAPWRAAPRSATVDLTGLWGRGKSGLPGESAVMRSAQTLARIEKAERGGLALAQVVPAAEDVAMNAEGRERSLSPVPGGRHWLVVQEGAGFPGKAVGSGGPVVPPLRAWLLERPTP